MSILKKSVIPTDKKNELSETLSELIKEYHSLALNIEGQINAIGIYTDADMTTFLLGYNTEEGVKEIIDRQLDTNALFPDDPCDRPLDDNKWLIPEWISESYEDLIEENNTKLIKANELISKLYEANVHKNFVHYKSEMFDILCDVIATLKKSGVFGPNADQLILLVQVSDNGLNNTREKSIKKILTKVQLEEYKSFLETW